MRNFFELMLYTVYSYYKGGKWEFYPIVHTRATLAFMMMMNTIMILNIAGYQQEFFSHAHPAVIAAIEWLPFFILLSIFVKEEKVRKLEFSEFSKRKMIVFLLCYIVFSFIGWTASA